MKILVCGGRDYFDYKYAFSVLENLNAKLGPFSTVIHGGASGADSIGGMWARSKEISEWCFPPDWKHYGKAAGSVRNQQMLDEGKPDLVIAFPGGRGTADMIWRTKFTKIALVEVP